MVLNPLLSLPLSALGDWLAGRKIAGFYEQAREMFSNFKSLKGIFSSFQEGRQRELRSTCLSGAHIHTHKKGMMGAEQHDKWMSLYERVDEHSGNYLTFAKNVIGYTKMTYVSFDYCAR